MQQQTQVTSTDLQKCIPSLVTDVQLLIIRPIGA